LHRELIKIKFLNIHTRTIHQPKNKVVELLETISTENDQIWPTENWPKMKFKDGIGVGAKGGHGPIRYMVEVYNPEEIILFRFSSPKGFNGIHKLELKEITSDTTQIQHTIDICTVGIGTWNWLFAIRSTRCFT
jgi:hypothetical protein